MAIGALSVSGSAVLLDLAHTSPGTASFYRCALALPALLVLAAAERSRARAVPRHRYGLALFAGALFAGDMRLWTQAIGEVGAGLSTVLVNVQVVLVPLLAWAVDREPVPRRFLWWLPVLLVGVVLTGGMLEQGGTVGSDPLRGTVHAVLAAVCYPGFLYLLRREAMQARYGRCIQRSSRRRRWFRWPRVCCGTGSTRPLGGGSSAGCWRWPLAARSWGGCWSRPLQPSWPAMSVRSSCCSPRSVRWRWAQSYWASAPARYNWWAAC
jgi:hypothetical protein